MSEDHVCCLKGSGSDRCLICWLTDRGACYPWDISEALHKWEPQEVKDNKAKAEGWGRSIRAKHTHYMFTTPGGQV